MSLVAAEPGRGGAQLVGMRGAGFAGELPRRAGDLCDDCEFYGPSGGAARSSCTRKGWNVADDGMFGAPPIDVVVGDGAHVSILKALSLAGFGKKRLTRVEADGQGRMRPDKLPRLTDRTILCMQAGNVNTGAFDPAAEICARAREQGAWVHVDGAFGLWAAVSPKYAHLTKGFEQADSWATDAHKWPNVSYDSGIVLVKNGAALRSPR